MSENGNTQTNTHKTFGIQLPSEEVSILLLLGKQPEMRYAGQSSQPVISFSGAASRSYKNAAGEWTKITAWYRVSLWREAAERLNARNLQPGDLVKVVYNTADIQAHPYTKTDGTPGASLEITAQKVSVVATNSVATHGDAVPETASEEETEIPF